MRKMIVAILGAVLLATAVWQTLPTLVNALPGRVQQRIPPHLMAQLITPLPTALPAPLVTAAPVRITIPPPPTTTPTPTFPPQPTTAAATAATAVPDTPPSPTPTVTPSPTPLPASAQLAGLANIPQKFNNCGPTNLSLTLAYFGVSADQLTIAALLKPNENDRNVSPEEMVAYVNNETPLRAAVYRGGDLDLLKQLISAGFPVIIEKGLFPSEWEGWMGHYLTVYGYDDAVQEFTSMDTFLGPWDNSGRADSYATIAEFWAQFNYAFLLVYPPEREDEIKAILGANLLDGRAMWRLAAQQAQADIETTPGNAFAWFNLGSSLTRLAKLTGQDALYESAATAFDQARLIGLPRRMLWYQFEPYEAYLAAGRIEDVLALADATLASEGGRNVEETYLYQGRALRATGDEAKAKAAFERALQLNPNFTPARQALAAGDDQ